MRVSLAFSSLLLLLPFGKAQSGTYEQLPNDVALISTIQFPVDLRPKEHFVLVLRYVVMPYNDSS
jgi:hypothetical protein